MANAKRGALKDKNGVYILPYTDNVPCDTVPVQNSNNLMRSGDIHTVKANLETLISGKAASQHTHAIADTSGLQEALNQTNVHNASMASHAAGFNHNILIQKVMGNGDRYEVVLNNNGAGQNFHIWLDSTKDGVTSRVFPFYFSIDTGAVTIGTELHVGNAYISTVKSGVAVEGLLQSRNLELWPLTDTGNYGGYIDFHYNRSNSDYTARIIEDTSGTIHVLNNLKTGDVIAGNVTATGNVTAGNVTVTGLVTSGADALRMDHGDYKVWLRKDPWNFYILLSDAGGSTWNGKRPLTIDLQSGRINLQKRPYYSGETDVTSAWSGGSWTATGDGWLIVGMGRSSGAWTLRDSNGKVIAHVGKNDSGAVMTAYPIPVNEGERYTIYAAATGYQTLAAVDDTKKAAPAWAYYVPGRGA